MTLKSERRDIVRQFCTGAAQKEVLMSDVKRSAGNVFRDLGLPADEADHLRIRSSLMGHLRRLIEARGLSQVEAAKLLGVTQPRVSDLVRGRIDLFSIDTLVDLLARAGVSVRLEVGSSARGRSRVA